MTTLSTFDPLWHKWPLYPPIPKPKSNLSLAISQSLVNPKKAKLSNIFLHFSANLWLKSQNTHCYRNSWTFLTSEQLALNGPAVIYIQKSKIGYVEHSRLHLKNSLVEGWGGLVLVIWHDPPINPGGGGCCVSTNCKSSKGNWITSIRSRFIRFLVFWQEPNHPPNKP